MPTWIPMFAVPHIDAQEPIEVPGIALVSLRDDRLKALAKKHRRFAMYLRRFKSEFGQQIWPSIIIRETSSPEEYRSVEAIAGFRDAIAVSVIRYSWALALCFENTFGIRYANWFSFWKPLCAMLCITIPSYLASITISTQEKRSEPRNIF